MSNTMTHSNGNFSSVGRRLDSGMPSGEAIEQGSNYEGQSSETHAHQHLGNIGSVHNRKNSYFNQKAGGHSYQQCGDSTEKGASDFWAAKSQPVRK